MILNVKRARNLSEYQLLTAGRLELQGLCRTLNILPDMGVTTPQLARSVHEALSKLPDDTDRLDLYAAVVKSTESAIDLMTNTLFLIMSDPDAFDQEQMKQLHGSVLEMLGGSTELFKLVEKTVEVFAQDIQSTE